MKVLDLPADEKAIFKERINRFTGIVDIIGGESNVKIHIHDSGRLGEILFPGNVVYIKRAPGKKRKTKWDLIAGDVDGRIVFVNSMYHRRIAVKLITELQPFGRVIKLIPEYKFNNSRLDFFLESDGGKFLIETKGCTLGENGVALFPDAPTERGRRHLEELMEARRMGFNAAVVFLVFRDDTECFAPHEERDPAFALTYRTAIESGVVSRQFQFAYDGMKVTYKGEIPLCGEP